MVSTKKVVVWLLLAFVVFYVLSSPESSADLLRSAVAGLGNAADALTTFVQRLF